MFLTRKLKKKHKCVLKSSRYNTHNDGEDDDDEYEDNINDGNCADMNDDTMIMFLEYKNNIFLCCFV